MKTAFLASVFWVGYHFGGSALAEQKYPAPVYPPPNFVGDWNTISERFKEWKIVEFEYGGGIADGGSIGFRFKMSDDTEMNVVVVCESWWTEDDWKRKRQPIYLACEKKAFHVLDGDDTETRLLTMLNQAALNLKGEGRKHPKYIDRLIEIVKSRNIPDGDWPYDRLDFEDDFGNWNTIRERFMKWEIVEFNEWGTLADASIIFWFKTSDNSKIGVLVSLAQWSEEDQKLDRQEIFVHFGKKLYRVPKGDEIETRLIAMLDQAATNLKGEGPSHSKYIERLRDAVKTRKLPFSYWPMTYVEVKGSK